LYLYFYIGTLSALGLSGIKQLGRFMIYRQVTTIRLALWAALLGGALFAFNLPVGSHTTSEGRQHAACYALAWVTPVHQFKKSQFDYR
jgi:hypothetical protein